ncbi:MAG: 2-oxoglutarate dehydrogenase E1 component [Kangiellaceae bacterium]|nr:2-oxoglutarate dehydrogenase E1 component [Kangiellaceae bacterium]
MPPENDYLNQTKESVLNGTNALYLEEMLENGLQDKNDALNSDTDLKGWEEFLSEHQLLNNSALKNKSHSKIREEFIRLANRKHLANSSESINEGGVSLQGAVAKLINAYRTHGHKMASIDPLNLKKAGQISELTLESFGLSSRELQTEYDSDSLLVGRSKVKLKEIVKTLQNIYCQSIAAEYMYIDNSDEREWMRQQIEARSGDYQLTPPEKRDLLDRLTAAEGIEKFLASKYPGVKRFGLEGAESLIPLLDQMIQKSSNYAVEEIVLGMAHRGRINVLINILGKKVADLLDEFEGKAEYTMGSGDVKYHQGFSSDIKTETGEVHLALAFNPSHLEIVAPVIQGSVRARQDVRNDTVGEKVLPIVLHGDAAFSGQGVVMETFQMSQTRAYKTGGTIHIVINNQVGFTTSKKEDARSTEYCTDIAKSIGAPVIHVNGDDPEAVILVSRLAMDYRAKFNKDIIIDLVCYRRRGHNEAEEPSGTQPKMYQVIKNLPTTLTSYTKKLVDAQIVDQAEPLALVKDYRERFGKGEQVTSVLNDGVVVGKHFSWSRHINVDEKNQEVHRHSLNSLKELAGQISHVPETFTLHRQVKKLLNDWSNMANEETPVNWGFAENLAYASILNAGSAIRISGQDVGRGTFSHRHCVLHDQKISESYIPLQHLQGDNEKFEVYDSLLSELAVLGFEYGYSTTNPNTLVIWEAQFGDFANGAQMIIDQFITSGEHKWGRLSGLTMLLPHGYEGQGPEHSSARLERFLQLCAEHNIQVCVPTTPAQIYHLLRRQILNDQRKPLIVMSPKSLLRHQQAVSTLKELSDGEFQKIIVDNNNSNKEDTTRLVLCSGRVYYDLLEQKTNKALTHVQLIRVEQLYPFPTNELTDVLKSFGNAKEVIWCQEEPKNQGAWYSSQHHLRECADALTSHPYLTYAGREASAAPAAGYTKLHENQRQEFLKQALEDTI